MKLVSVPVEIEDFCVRTCVCVCVCVSMCVCACVCVCVCEINAISLLNCSEASMLSMYVTIV